MHFETVLKHNAPFLGDLVATKVTTIVDLFELCRTGSAPHDTGMYLKLTFL